MHSLNPVIERLLRHLAHKIGYDLSQGEINLYRVELSKYPIHELADACLEAEKEFDQEYNELYPSLAWFKRKLSVTLKENHKRA